MSFRPSVPPSSATVLVDHVSSAGPVMTHIRGILLVKSVENLRQAGLFERYAAELSPALREQIGFMIASSWLPVQMAEEHYAACDRLALSEAETERLGALMAEQMGNSVMSSVLKATRSAGVEHMWTALKQFDRFWDRWYVGGGITVIQTGPKDLILEFHGMPHAKSHHFRAALRSYWLSIGRLVTHAVYARLIQPRVPHPHCIALAGSWV